MHPAIAAGPVAATARRIQPHMYVSIRSMPTCCRHVQYVNASPYACTSVYACMNVRRYACVHASMHVLVSASMYMSKCIRLQAACWQMQLCSCAMCMHVGV